MAEVTEDKKEIGKPRYGRGQHPNSRKQLEKGMARPGDVLNPKGKPPGTLDFKTRFEKKLHAISPDKVRSAKGIADFCAGVGSNEITNADAMEAVLLYKAIVERDLGSIKEILDRTDGKAVQKTEVTGAGGGPLLLFSQLAEAAEKDLK